ncbi:6837_t:CDS:2, partial [Gigaspora rosea]
VASSMQIQSNKTTKSTKSSQDVVPSSGFSMQIQSNKTTKSTKSSQEVVPSSGFSMQIQSNKTKNKKLEKRNLSLFASEPSKKRRITDNDINEPTIELVTGFEDNQIQSLNPKGRTDQPIIIPTLKNPDWIERSQALAAGRSKNSDKVQSLKQQAIAEILKGPKTDSDIEQPEQTLVLKVEKNKNLESRKEKVSELEAFRREVENLPDEADIDYDSVPIEDFGAAMLRGMGWKPGMTIGKNQKIKSIELREPKARPTHLGLGASPLPTKDA